MQVVRTGPDPQVLGFEIQRAANFVQPNTLDKAQDKMLELARANVARGRPYLNKRSGNLQESIEPHRTRLRVGVQVDLTRTRYARIHELGGVILPKKSPFLSFQIDGRWVRTRRVEIPKRPYLEPAQRSVGERLPEIVYAVIDEVFP